MDANASARANGACRALVYLIDGTIVSKIAGGEAVLRRGAGPAEVIRRALGQQRGTEPGQPPAASAVGFVLATAAALRSAAVSLLARARRSRSRAWLATPAVCLILGLTRRQGRVVTIGGE